MRNAAALGLVGLFALVADAQGYDGRNTGAFNTGAFNTGAFNTGAFNTGAFNTVVFNTGAFNTGAFNTGAFNTGAFNTGAFNTGAFNTQYMNGSSIPAASTTKSGSLTQGQWQYLGAYPVTEGRTFSVAMTGTGDADLYVKFGDSDYRTFNCRPYTGGSVESCNIVVPTNANTAFVSVNGYSASTFNATINGFDGFGVLNNGFLNAGIAGKTRMRGAGTVTAGQWAQLGAFPVTAGNTFRVHMTGTADSDVYVRFGAGPTDSLFACRPFTGSSNENCDIVVPSGASMAYVAVKGYSSSATFVVDVLDFDFGMSGMVSSQGNAIDGVALNGTVLSGSTYGMVWGRECEDPYGCWDTYTWGYTTISTYGFIGATIQSTITDDDQRVVGTATTRIANVHSYWSSSDPETAYTYDVEAYLGTRDASGNTTWAWYPLCGKDQSNNMIGATPLKGTWNYQSGALNGGKKISSSANQITWACLNGALGKAATSHSVPLPDGMGTGYGYKPWASQNVWVKQTNQSCTKCNGQYTWVINTSTGADSHQAATRMIRADYCGDGMAHTIAGRHLDVWDMLPNPVNTKGVNYTPEASWNYNGANDWGCNGRVDDLWARECQPGQVYCEAACPTYQYDLNGQTVTSAPHVFDRNDDNMPRCLMPTSYTSGTGFNRNELVNTNQSETWGLAADKSFARSIVH